MLSALNMGLLIVFLLAWAIAIALARALLARTLFHTFRLP